MKRFKRILVHISAEEPLPSKLESAVDLAHRNDASLTLFDVVPAAVVFGAGAMMMVAPLTTALMTSVPEHNSGLASAVNNPISRGGPQLATAVIFIVANAILFGTLGDLAPELDTTTSEVRNAFSPLNRPAEGTPPDQVAAAAEASTGPPCSFPIGPEAEGATFRTTSSSSR